MAQAALDDLLDVVVHELLAQLPAQAQALTDGVEGHDIDPALREQRGVVESVQDGADGRGVQSQDRRGRAWMRRAGALCAGFRADVPMRVRHSAHRYPRRDRTTIWCNPNASKMRCACVLSRGSVNQWLKTRPFLQLVGGTAKLVHFYSHACWSLLEMVKLLRPSLFIIN